MRSSKQVAIPEQDLNSAEVIITVLFSSLGIESGVLQYLISLVLVLLKDVLLGLEEREKWNRVLVISDRKMMKFLLW